MTSKEILTAISAVNFTNSSRSELKKNILEVRGEALVRMEELVNQDTEMSAAAAKEFDSINAQLELLEKKATAHGIELQATSRTSSGSGPGEDVTEWKAISAEQKGASIKVLGPRSRLADHVPADGSGLTMMDYVKGRLGGNVHSREFANAMSTAADAATVPVHLSTEIIDLARAKSQIFAAGAQTVPMTSKTLTIARVTGDPVAGWKAENSSHSSTDATTEPLTFTARTIIASTKMSVELSEDAPNGSRIITEALAAQIALGIDRAALIGSGEGAEPSGILTQAGVNVLDLGINGAALFNYGAFSRAYQTILEANGTPNALLYAPRTWGDVDRFEDIDGNPLRPPASYGLLNILPTSQIPTNVEHGAASNASYAFMGDFSQLMIGVRTSLNLEVFRMAADGEDSAFSNLQVWMRAYARIDVQLARPSWFTVIKGILPGEDPFAGS